MRLIYTICPFPDEARSIAKALVEEGHAACANYWPVQSVFSHQGACVFKEETALLIKVAHDNLDTARKLVREMHSYSVPAIIVLKPESVNNNYLQWVHDIAGGQKGTP